MRTALFLSPQSRTQGVFTTNAFHVNNIVCPFSPNIILLYQYYTGRLISGLQSTLLVSSDFYLTYKNVSQCACDDDTAILNCSC